MCYCWQKLSLKSDLSSINYNDAFFFLTPPLASMLESNNCQGHFHLIKGIEIIIQGKMSVIPHLPIKQFTANV